ncbi:VOC family protein [Streptomyces sp. NPDC004647]|uniref:VOC family protein n=1 Tax=Streptomyces sp. NPDC004647 TaxID=3154671 RepID=UPI0033A7801E
MAAFPEGAPCWVDASLPDLEAGKRFYGGLFGWTFDEGSPDFGYYTQALSDGKKVAGLAPVMEGQEGTPPAWGVYFASRDIAETAEKIRANGGMTLMGPMEVGDLGSMLIAKDPGDAVFGVWQPGTHKGFDRQYQPGSFGWVEICVRETGGVDAFYPAVFSYEVQPVGDQNFDFSIWKLEGQPVAGRFKLGDDIPADVPPHAMVYFVVANCDDAIASVQKLGGKLRTGPRDSPYGRFAIVADQQGATFSVIDPRTTAGQA